MNLNPYLFCSQCEQSLQKQTLTTTLVIAVMVGQKRTVSQNSLSPSPSPIIVHRRGAHPLSHQTRGSKRTNAKPKCLDLTSSVNCMYSLQDPPTTCSAPTPNNAHCTLNSSASPNGRAKKDSVPKYKTVLIQHY